MQDHARGLLSGDKVESKLYDLMFESLEFERTLEHLSSAREEIRAQTMEVRIVVVLSNFRHVNGRTHAEPLGASHGLPCQAWGVAHVNGIGNPITRFRLACVAIGQSPMIAVQFCVRQCCTDDRIQSPGPLVE